MIFLQFNDEGHNPPCSYFVVVLESDNVERMERADMVSLAPARIGGTLRPVKYPADLYLFIAYEKRETIGRLYEMYTRGDVEGIMDTISRGWQMKPTDGLRAVMPKDGVKHA